MFDINIAIGRVGKDPELRHTKSGAPVVHFRLATNERVSDGAGETKRSRDERMLWFTRNPPNPGLTHLIWNY